MMHIGKLLDPKNDYVFKRIFGYVGNEEITKGLLSAIIDDIHIESITLDCKEILEQELRSDKFGILDIKAIIDNSIQCDIEMQMIDRKDIENRILFYWSMLCSKSLKIGERYKDAKRTIVILFIDYELEGLKEIEKYISKWHIREDEYKHLILTKNLELVIIEMPKYERYTGEKKQLDRWVKFITNPGGMSMDDIKNNEALKKAREVLNDISSSEEEQELAFQRLIYKMDQAAIEEAGYDKGLKVGIEKGLQQGEKEKAKEIAKRMLKDELSIEIIMSYTELTKEEIEELK